MEHTYHGLHLCFRMLESFSLVQAKIWSQHFATLTYLRCMHLKKLNKYMWLSMAISEIASLSPKVNIC